MKEDFYNNLIQLSKDTRFGPIVESVINTSKGINFENYLDFSFNRNIVFSSDYAGEDCISKYYTYTFTLQSFSSLRDWHKNIIKLKAVKGYSGEASYKDTKRKTREGKLRDWLEVTVDCFNGFIFCVAVPVNTESLFAPTMEQLYVEIFKNPDFKDCPFKAKILEKSFRITSFSALILSFIFKNDYGIWWMTDNDSIVQDDEKRDYSSRLLQHSLNLMVPDLKSFNLGYSLPFTEENESDNFSKDFLSLSDLLSGAVNDYCNIYNPNLSLQEIYNRLKPKSLEIIKFAKDIPAFIYLLDENENGILCKRLDIEIRE